MIGGMNAIPRLAALLVCAAPALCGARAIALEAPVPAQVDAAASSASGTAGAVVRHVGFARALPMLATAAAVHDQWQWAVLPEGGAVAAVTVRSSGAAALRIGLRVGELPEGAIVRFYAARGGPTFAVSARDIAAAFARNRHAGGVDAAARTYWSPVIEGDAIVVEVEIAPGADREAVRVAMPLLSHFAAGPRERFGADAAPAAAIVTRDGESYACPGMLVSSRRGSGYFVTASGCAPEQGYASSLQPFWFDAARGFETVAGGATLLAVDGKRVAFLQLHGKPPADARAASWPGAELAAFLGDSDLALEQWLGGSAGAVEVATEAALHR